MGITLTVMIGPVFFSHLQTTLYRGFKAGMILLIGIVISDLAQIFLTYIGTAQIVGSHKNELLLGIIGGSLLISFGVFSYFKKLRFKDLRPKESPIMVSGALANFFKGFFLNFFNPFVWLFWIGVVSLVNSEMGDSKLNVFIFFAVLEGVYLVLNVLKAFAAYKVKKFVRPKTIVIINKTVGASLVIFGIILILRVIFF